MRKLFWRVPVALVSALRHVHQPGSLEPGYLLHRRERATGSVTCRTPTYGACPKETEGTFLASLERGRGYRANPPQALPYYERMDATREAAPCRQFRRRARTACGSVVATSSGGRLHIANCSCSYAAGGGGRN